MTKRKNAFTLAEVLITLAVIGIVAALTIPGLVKNHNEKAWATAQDVFTKKLEVAMKAMNTDGTLTGYSTTASFVNALKKNIKINKVCTDDVTKCFSKALLWDANSKVVEVKDDVVEYETTLGQEWAETVGVQFADGTNALLAYNKNCTSEPFNNQFAASASCIGIIFDVNGFKLPNQYGSTVSVKDVWANANVKTVAKKKVCVFQLDDFCVTKLLKSGTGFSPMSLSQCQKAVEDNILGITSCYYSSDYWAGAVAACGGVDNMPNLRQLADLAEYVYNYNGTINEKDKYTDVDLDYDKARPFLAQSAHSDRFFIWAQGEAAQDTSDARAYYDYMTDWDYSNRPDRSFSDPMAACVDNN